MNMEHLTLPEQRVLFAEFSRAAYWNAADGKMFGKGKGMKAHKLFDIDGAQVHVWHNNTDLVIGARGTEPSCDPWDWIFYMVPLCSYSV